LSVSRLLCISSFLVAHHQLIAIASSTSSLALYFLLFFFNDTPTTEIYTLSLHDALPISKCPARRRSHPNRCVRTPPRCNSSRDRDRKSTRLNSSHGSISYAVFCLKKKKKKTKIPQYYVKSYLTVTP